MSENRHRWHVNDIKCVAVSSIESKKSGPKKSPESRASCTQCEHQQATIEQGNAQISQGQQRVPSHGEFRTRREEKDCGHHHQRRSVAAKSGKPFRVSHEESNRGSDSKTVQTRLRWIIDVEARVEIHGIGA